MCGDFCEFIFRLFGNSILRRKLAKIHSCTELEQQLQNRFCRLFLLHSSLKYAMLQEFSWIMVVPSTIFSIPMSHLLIAIANYRILLCLDDCFYSNVLIPWICYKISFICWNISQDREYPFGMDVGDRINSGVVVLPITTECLIH